MHTSFCSLVHILYAIDPLTIYYCSTTLIQGWRLLSTYDILVQSMDIWLCIYYSLVHLWCNCRIEYEIQFHSNVYLPIRSNASWPEKVQWFWDSLGSVPKRTTWSGDFFGRNLSAIDLLIHWFSWNDLADFLNDWLKNSILECQYLILAASTYHCCIG